MRTGPLSAAAYSGMFVFGVVLALLGAVLPLVSGRIGGDLARAGNLFLGMNFAMLLTSAAVGPLMDRFGEKLPMLAGPLLVAAALAMVASAASYAALMGALMALGAGGALLNSSANTLIADLHPDGMPKNAALNLLGIFFGIGAVWLPFAIGSLLAALGLAGILYIALVVALAPAAISAALAFPAPKHGERVPLAETARLARHPVVLAFGALLFFESGNEFILGGYMSTYLARELDSPVWRASLLLALYWASLIAVRVAASRFLLKVPGGRVIIAGAMIAAVGVGFLALARGEWMAAAALVLTGSGVACIFPTALGLAGSRFGEYSGSVFGLLFAMGLTGGMALPWALGHLAAGAGLRTALLLPAAGFLAIAAIQAGVMGRASPPPSVREEPLSRA